jgi:hypothetical protein
VTQPSQPAPKKSPRDSEAGLGGAYKGGQIGSGQLPWAKKGAKTGGRVGTNTNLPKVGNTLPKVGKRIETAPKPTNTMRKGAR